MSVALEGGCRVSPMNEGHPMTNGSMKIWNQIGRATGAQAISLRVIEFSQGVSPLIQNSESDEVFYSLEQIEGRPPTNGRCKVHIEGKSFEVEAQTGLYLKPGQTMLVENQNITPVTFISVLCPEPPVQNVAHGYPTSLNQPATFPG